MKFTRGSSRWWHSANGDYAIQRVNPKPGHSSDGYRLWRFSDTGMWHEGDYPSLGSAKADAREINKIYQ